jgi:hypothetical protein
MTDKERKLDERIMREQIAREDQERKERERKEIEREKREERLLKIKNSKKESSFKTGLSQSKGHKAIGWILFSWAILFSVFILWGIYEIYNYFKS